jgi:hypothetical protein
MLLRNYVQTDSNLDIMIRLIMLQPPRLNKDRKKSDEQQGSGRMGLACFKASTQNLPGETEENLPVRTDNQARI